jgi:hypothetical protein
MSRRALLQDHLIELHDEAGRSARSPSWADGDSDSDSDSGSDGESDSTLTLNAACSVARTQTTAAWGKAGGQDGTRKACEDANHIRPPPPPLPATNIKSDRHLIN